PGPDGHRRRRHPRPRQPALRVGCRLPLRLPQPRAPVDPAGDPRRLSSKRLQLRPMAGTFRSLKGRNFRLYMCGQSISMAGTFMQAVAQAWLVLKITGSGTALGLATLLQYLPMTLL